MFFNVMDVIFPIMFIVVAGFIVVTIIKGISQWNDNNHAPRLTVEAKVVAKRTNIRISMMGQIQLWYIQTQLIMLRLRWRVEIAWK